MTDNTEDVSVDLFDKALEQMASDDEISVDIKPNEKVDQQPHKNKYEDEARTMGYKSLEELVAEGKDPDDYKSPKEFVAWEKLKKIDNERIANAERKAEANERALKLLYDKRFEDKMAEFKKQLDEKASYADVDGVRETTKQMEDLRNETYQSFQPQQQQQIQQLDPALIDWNAKNQWVQDMSTEKARDAHAIYEGLKKTMPNVSEKDRLTILDDKLAKLHPVTNPLRSVPTQSERGTTPTTKTPGRLSWSDQTREELGEWEKYGQDLFVTKQGKPDKAKWLEVIARDRKAGK